MSSYFGLIPNSFCASLTIDKSAISLRGISRSILAVFFASSTINRRPASGSAVLVEHFDGAVVVGARGFPIDFLPIHQKLDRSVALAPDIAIGLDAGSNDPFHFVRFLFDFFHRGD